MDKRSAQEAYNAACDELEKREADYDALADDASDEDVTEARAALDAALEAADKAKAKVDDFEARERARAKHTKIELPKEERKEEKAEERMEPVKVDEPDMYRRDKPNFVRDLYFAQIKGDLMAQRRLGEHQQYELSRMPEQRAIATGTLGGVIPPQYLVDMYAKASRNGRVFADQVNHQPLSEQGMSEIIPRLTQGLSAAAQSSESSGVSTQDVTETDLTVNVRTYAGYSPVSRQTLERAQYSEAILFEDLIARYFAALDVGCINGGGGSGTHLGVLQTSSIESIAVSTLTIAGIWPKLADAVQRVNKNVGGLGYVADKIFMHPSRWGWFLSLMDSQNRPVFGINGDGQYFNAAGGGASAGYGFVGTVHGLPVYTDANIPTNLGAGTNEDRIIVTASAIQHLWERDGDPVTLSFEQQAGTSLQVQLVAYGYSAFTAGRYPNSNAVLTGLTTPSF